MYPVYRGLARQRGHGLGDMLKSVFRTVAPVLKPVVSQGLHALKDAALTHGKEFLQNVLIDKQNPKEAFLKAGKNVLLHTGKELLGPRATPINSLPSGSEGISQQGQGRKRRRGLNKKKKKFPFKKHSTKKRKRTSRDLDDFDY